MLMIFIFKEEIKMKKDEMPIEMKKYYAEIIPSNYLLKGMYVA